MSFSLHSTAEIFGPKIDCMMRIEFFAEFEGRARLSDASLHRLIRLSQPAATRLSGNEKLSSVHLREAKLFVGPRQTSRELDLALARLRSCGLVVSNRHPHYEAARPDGGSERIYLRDRILLQLQEPQEHHEEVRTKSQNTPRTTTFMSVDQLADTIKDTMVAGRVLIFDLRPSFRFYASHVKGAVCIGCPPAMLRAQTMSEAIAVLSSTAQDELPMDARQALEQLELADTVVLYDSSPAGEGGAARLAALLELADGVVEVLSGGFAAFAKAHPSLCIQPPNSAGHSSARGVIDLTPRGADGAKPADCCLTLDGGRFHVWVGGARDANDRALFERARVTHVINTTAGLPCRFKGAAPAASVGQAVGDAPPLRPEYLKLGLEDTAETDIRAHLDECCAFLDRARAAAAAAAASTAASASSAAEATAASLTSSSHSALVHCHMGRSRSVTIAAAYAAHTLGIGSAAEAIAVIKAKRAEAAPNHGFVAQLDSWIAEKK